MFHEIPYLTGSSRISESRIVPIESIIIGSCPLGLDSKKKTSYRTHPPGEYVVYRAYKRIKEKLHAREKTSLVGDRIGVFDERRLLWLLGPLVQSAESLPGGAVLSAGLSASLRPWLCAGTELFLAGRRCAGAERARRHDLAALPVS